MSLRISKLYGMDLFTDTGKFLGRVQDLIIDLERGEVVRISMEGLQGVSRDEAKRILREKSLMYKNVRSVEDVIVVSKGSGGQTSLTEVMEEKQSREPPGFLGR